MTTPASPLIYVTNNCDLPNLARWLRAHPAVRAIVVESAHAALFKAAGVQVIPLDPDDPRSCVDHALPALKAGHSIAVAPLGAPAPSPFLLAHDAVFARVAEASGAPVVPCWISTWKDARDLAAEAAPIPPEKVTVAAVREALYQLGAQAYSSRSCLDESLGLACIRALKQRFSSTVFTDAFRDNMQMSGGKLLCVGFALAAWIKKNIPEERVGIVLPPGAGAAVANLASVLANKTPVNLNFTAGFAANESAIARAGLRSVITASAFEPKVKNFPWPEQRWDLPDILGRQIGKFKIAAQMPAAFALSPSALAKLHGVRPDGGDREAAMLFTSGSSGEPKGVPLTHRNILANVGQLGEILPSNQLPSLLGCLPIFHSFGFTATLWWPILGGPAAVTYPSPLETAKLAEIIQKHSVSLVISTPTFLRGYLKKASREQFAQVKMVVVGAEKLPHDLADAFLHHFGIPVHEGYGLTETSPVIGVNLPDFLHDQAHFPGQTCHRPGSIGRLLPGVAVQVSDPDTGVAANVFTTGMLSFRGANVFGGYFGDPARNAECLRDGWFRTGDLGRLDADGFLHIEGRLSRFSKIAGEMVPHGTIEEHLNAAFAEGGKEESQFVIASRHCPQRGEELVLVTTTRLELSEIAAALRARGVPNLWIPYVIERVDAIPVLASGKFDLREIRRLAESAP